MIYKCTDSNKYMVLIVIKNKIKESHMTTLITCNDNVIIEVNF